jgi:hypothetical protein
MKFRTVSNRIEFDGCVVMGQPEPRVPPPGGPRPRFRADCGEREGELVMPVVMAGADAPMHAATLAPRVVRSACWGALRFQNRSTGGASGPVLEIAANQILERAG